MAAVGVTAVADAAAGVNTRTNRKILLGGLNSLRSKERPSSLNGVTKDMSLRHNGVSSSGLA